MMRVAINNLTNPGISPLVVDYCDTYLCRLRGLTFRLSLAHSEGLLLVQSRENRVDTAIHMIGVFINLTVVWINSSAEVVDVRLARRWRPIYVPKRPARYILEMAPTRLEDFHVGDKVEIKHL